MKKILLAIILFLTISLAPLSLYAAGTSIKGSINDSLKKTATEAKYDTSKSGDSAFVSLIGGIIKVIMGILGIVLLGYLIYGGFLWMTAGGEGEQVNKAKAMMKNAVIGIIIISASYVIADFVMKQLSSVVSGISSST